MKTNMKSETKSERKTETMAKNKANRMGLLRKGIIMILVMAAALSLIGCSGTKLSGDFDEEKVKAAAQEAIDYLVAGEYEACVSLMGEEMQAAISAEVLAGNMETMTGQKGAFQEYKSCSVVGQKDKEGTESAVAVVVAAFEKGNLTFTVSFDKEMKMIGFWMK
ncbi:DUF3887 domain-containing protein [Acetatifactor aquisgranensis]|uniref:DUF3887 domain-containing protein n=1 Tax=Acetatifactor aquisgranensis TaxID=2941233 RepID=UPI00203AFB62|nr:DUF3887 domain-containing protein [Acetatifactor aquisgranensis]